MPWRRGAEKPTVRQRPSAWDDRRRNRNLGTAKRGHGKSSPSVIPTPRWYGERFFSEVLYRPDHVIRSVGNIKLEFLIERPRTGYHYACTIDDIVHQMMNLMPWRRDWKGIKTFLFRQPSRKQEVMTGGVWGRLIHRADDSAAICFEAQDPDKPVRWTRALDPDGQRELRRLEEEGHRIIRESHHHLIYCTMDSIRNTQLYRTLLHEIGHLVDRRRRGQKDLWVTSLVGT